MKVKTTLLLVTSLLIGLGCSDISFEQEIFQNQEVLTKKFENNKGEFTPVERYDITYLSQQPKVRAFSLAQPILDVQMYICNHSSDVRVVSDGEVKRVASVKNYRKIVMVNHGEYYTVYAGLDEVLVNEGDLLHTNTVIGKLLPMGDEELPFRFMIYKNRTQLDPSEWLVD